jgi:hypothetical protein
MEDTAIYYTMCIEAFKNPSLYMWYVVPRGNHLGDKISYNITVNNYGYCDTLEECFSQAKLSIDRLMGFGPYFFDGVDEYE